MKILLYSLATKAGRKRPLKTCAGGKDWSEAKVPVKKGVQHKILRVECAEEREASLLRYL